LGEIAKADTTPQPSGATVNEVFLFEVPEVAPRLVVNCLENQRKLGECRFDIHPFMEKDGSTLTVNSDIFEEGNQKIGVAKLKVAFYSKKWGKLRVRIFHLEFLEETKKQFREAKVRVTCGIHAQSTFVKPLAKPFDESVEVVVLKPSSSLSFEVVH
jgi:hypothetical protein